MTKQEKVNRFAGMSPTATDAALARVRELPVQQDQPQKGPKGFAKPARPKERVTLHTTAELADRMRRAAYWLPGVTIASLCESALTAELVRLEKEHGPLKPIPPGQSVPTGRPVKRPS